MNENLEKLIQNAMSEISSAYELNDLIIHLYSQNEDGLIHLLKLVTSDYNGYTFNKELQGLAMTCVLNWGKDGLSALVNHLIEVKDFNLISSTMRFLGFLSSYNIKSIQYYNSKLECITKLELDDDKYRTESFVLKCKELLINIGQTPSNQPSSLFPDSLLLSMIFTNNETMQNHIFSSLFARWAKLNSKGLEQYFELINQADIDEQVVHLFLKDNPFILEPFHSQIWSKPRFGEDLIPDFLIKSMDNSYTVVEIEKPNMPIFTKQGELTAQVTHAKRQVLDFRNWIIRNSLYAKQKYKDIYNPFCLVVIGNESCLSEFEKNRLREENESTQGILKIVGFDWFHNRCNSIIDNLVRFGVDGSIIE